MIVLAVVLICSIIFLFLNRFQQFCLITLAALFPLSFGNIGSIKDLLFIEWLTPVFILFTINNFIPLRNQGRLISFNGTKMFILALIILTVWSIHSYIVNQVLDNRIIIGNAEGTRRLFYGIFNYILLYFSIVIFLYKNINEIDFDKWLKVLIVFSLVFGIIRIFAYFFHFDTPLLAGTFDYNPGARTKYGGIAYRIGGLSDIAIVGTSALIARYQLTKKINIFFMAIFLFILFLSGGRTIFVGLTLAILIYSIFFLRKFLVYIIITAVITTTILFAFTPDKVMQGQIGRLSSFKGGMQQQDKGRYITYTLSIENFKKNPLFGKGLKEYEGYIGADPSQVRFIRNQLFAGGHGSYITILGNLGLGGITYLFLMIFGGIILSFKKIRDYLYNNSYLTAVATFVFLMLIIKSVSYLTENNGLSDPSLFFIVGLVASIRIIENNVILSKE